MTKKKTPAMLPSPGALQMLTNGALLLLGPTEPVGWVCAKTAGGGALMRRDESAGAAHIPQVLAAVGFG